MQMIKNKIDHTNNFDALRLFAALFVLFSHQHAFIGIPEPLLFGSITWGTLGVMIFFSISGFLVSQSWRNDPHVGRFLIRRFLRIWPGLAVYTLLAACVLGPVATTWDLKNYFSNSEFYEFFENLKLITIRTYLPGVFVDNPLPKAVAGSIWTIPIEVRMYLILAIFGIIGLLKRPYLIALITVAFGAYYFYLVRDPTDYQFHFAMYFFAGVCFDLFRSKWEGNTRTMTALILATALIVWYLDAPRISLLLAISTLSIVFGCASTYIFNKFGKYGDFSYGIYIYAFTVQQTIVWLAGRHLSLLGGLIASTIFSFIFAVLSWNFVENPALSFKSRLKKPKTIGIFQ